jgi:uncharacterized membrane protein YhhN
VSATGWLVVAAMAVAVVDWVGVWQERKPLEYACKPAVLALLLVGAVLAREDAHSAHQWAWFIPALALSLVGDVFLMLPSDRFVPGLVAFLLAHVCYVVAFTPSAPPLGPTIGALAVAAVASGVLFTRVRRGLLEGGHRDLVLPVTVYVVAVSLTWVSAVVTLWRPDFPSTAATYAAVGATLFYASDGTIGWDRFVAHRRWMPVGIMVTYHLGQAALVLSLVGGTVRT